MNSWRCQTDGNGELARGGASSPGAADTPRSLVPPTCFPPIHTNSYASFSENARPGACNEAARALPDTSFEDLISSLTKFNIASSSGYSLPAAQSFESLDNGRAHVRSTSAAAGGTVSLRADKVPVWKGSLPPRSADGSGAYSPKVFLGGLPWDINEQGLLQALQPFAPQRVEWPAAGAGAAQGASAAPRGYVYVTLESERRVRALLAACRRDGYDSYYRLSSRKMRNKEVQVIPWATSDALWIGPGCIKLDAKRTVFVGALHGMITATGLYAIMNDIFDGVQFVAIDLDKNKYPIGSGRVTFNNVHSYICAVSCGFVEIRAEKFSKRIQIDPYLEDSTCDICHYHQGPYFCRSPQCFSYYCRTCWVLHHSSGAYQSHQCITRTSKAGAAHSLSPSCASASAPAPDASFGAASRAFGSNRSLYGSLGLGLDRAGREDGAAVPALDNVGRQIVGFENARRRSVAFDSESLSGDAARFLDWTQF